MAVRAPRPRKEPKQARARALVEAIREAGVIILRDEGAAALNTNRIAEVAGVSIGSLYQYFPNKEAIISEIFEELLRQEGDELHERKQELREWLMRPLPEVLRWLVDLTAARHLRLLELHADFYREFAVEFDIRNRVGRAELEDWRGQAVDFVVELLEREASRIRVKDIPRTADLCVRVLGATLTEVARDAPDQLADESFRHELVQILLGYLRYPEDAGSDDG
jgi:AcrR family transcriptional regulator